MKICTIRLGFVCLIIICSMYSAASGSSLNSSSSSSSACVFPSSNINNSSFKKKSVDHGPMFHLVPVLFLAASFVVITVTGFICWRRFPVRELSRVYKLQVLLSEDVGSVQRQLDEIATTFRLFTVNLNHSHRIMIDTLLLLSQQSDHIIYIFTTVTKKSFAEETKELFKRISLGEMEKFDIESLVNDDDFQNVRAAVSEAEQRNFRVVTILVAANGTYKPLIMNNSEKLKEDLKSFANSVRVENTLDVKVFCGLHKMNP